MFQETPFPRSRYSLVPRTSPTQSRLPSPTVDSGARRRGRRPRPRLSRSTSGRKRKRQGRTDMGHGLKANGACQSESSGMHVQRERCEAVRQGCCFGDWRSRHCSPPRAPPRSQLPVALAIISLLFAAVSWAFASDFSFKSFRV